MTEYNALLDGGFFTSPDNKSVPVSVRSNNPGAVNGAAWERAMKGYVTEIKYDGKNNTTVFSAPEYGVAVWKELLRRYRKAGHVTITQIVIAYGGSDQIEKYKTYRDAIVKWTGLSGDFEIKLDDYENLLIFAKAMFRYESGLNPLPWSNAQIMLGLKLDDGGKVEPAAPAAPAVKSDLASSIVRAMHRRSFNVAEGADVLNIVYVRGMDLDGRPNSDAMDKFNDLRCAIRVYDGVASTVGLWRATTDPGKYYVQNRINAGGAAQIADGQFQSWQVGMHRGNHEALVQTGGPVTVFRDDNEDGKRFGDQIDIGDFGINQHGPSGHDEVLSSVGPHSAGCLVAESMVTHRAFMKLVKTDARYKRDPRYVFETAVLPADEVLGVVAPAKPPVAPAPVPVEEPVKPPAMRPGEAGVSAGIGVLAVAFAFFNAHPMVMIGAAVAIAVAVTALVHLITKRK